MKAFTIMSSDIARCPHGILMYDACLENIREAAELARTGAFSEAAERCGFAAVLARRAAAMTPLVR